MFTVVWLKMARNELARLWNNAPAGRRNAVALAADRIDRLLRRNAAEEGESRWDNFRVLFESPLAVLYRVSPADRIVQVVSVWHNEKRNTND